MIFQIRWVRRRGILCVFICLILITGLSAKAQTKIGGDNYTNGFAVLELFTSEGCSSCPPAEALLEKIAKAFKDRPVYVLAYHVDYWDRLGWKDIFSQHAFSLRQYDYSRKLSGQVYTPQLVINGVTQGVGSDEVFVGSEIRRALSTPAKAKLSSTLHFSAVGKDSLFYAIQGQAAKVKLVVAIVKTHAISEVTRGENKGRTLSHTGIVLALKNYAISANKGSVPVALPDNFNDVDFEVISFLQNRQTGHILAASRTGQ